METLVARFDALQEAILRHIESGDTSLESHIQYWGNVRRENALMHYARKQGLTRLGLQPLPALPVTEYMAKQAIQIQLTLISLQKSQFGTEQWTLPEVSAELINTQPQNCLKKHGYSVEVWYDDNKNNAMVYTNWDAIYYQDNTEHWHKVKGKVDYNGCYFTDHTGDHAYFTLFSEDANKYGHSGHWTVHYKNQVISSSVVSSTQHSSFGTDEEPIPGPSTATDSATHQASPIRRRHQHQGSSPSSTTSPQKSVRIRRRRREGESGETPTKRRRGGGVDSAPTPEEVGSRHRKAETKGLSRLGQLQAEARDPPIILVRGSANALKCWRYRRVTAKHKGFDHISTVWNWVGDSSKHHSRLLIAFRSFTERENFVKHNLFPRESSYTFGSLNAL